jgi:hypothetical protein
VCARRCHIAITARYIPDETKGTHANRLEVDIAGRHLKDCPKDGQLDKVGHSFSSSWEDGKQELGGATGEIRVGRIRFSRTSNR